MKILHFILLLSYIGVAFSVFRILYRWNKIKNIYSNLFAFEFCLLINVCLYFVCFPQESLLKIFYPFFAAILAANYVLKKASMEK